MPTREIFWNIENHGIMYVLFAAALLVFLIGVYRLWRRWRIGAPERMPASMGKALRGVAEYALLQKRVFADRYSGILHMGIFVGFTMLFIATVVVCFDSHFSIDVYRGWVYVLVKLLANTLGLLALAGVIMAIVRRHIAHACRVETRCDDVVVEVLMILVLVGGFTLEGLRSAATDDPWAIYSYAGNLFAIPYLGLPDGVLQKLHQMVWWVHFASAMVLIAYLPYSKLIHSMLAPVSVFLRSQDPVGIQHPIDFEDEDAESFGKSDLREFGRKVLFYPDACVRCGRCQQACPSYASGKALSPLAVLESMKRGAKEAELSSHSPGDEDEGFPLIGTLISEQEIWDCTTCRACEQACPMFVEHADKLLELRRYLVLTEGKVAPELQEAFGNAEVNGNPWGRYWGERSSFAEKIGIRVADGESGCEVLVWQGCFSAFDARSQRVLEALAKLLDEAQVDYAILGNEERCCGDFARRGGNEYLFHELAQHNITALNTLDFKTIVTLCPHCLHVLKEEYPQFGGAYNVMHYSEYLVDLMKEGKLSFRGDGAGGTVTYHDSCYLARYRGVIEEPRSLLDAAGFEIEEMESNGEETLCCGGGGAHMWLEEAGDARMNRMRYAQVRATVAKTVAVSCPFCLSMIADARASDSEGGPETSDVLELIAGRLE